MPALPDLLIPARDRLNTARYQLRASDLDAAWANVGEAARLLDQAISELSPAPVPPKPTTTDSFGGTYGPEHGQALDLYPSGENGPHYGHELLCPVDGTVERYSIMVGMTGVVQITRDGAAGVSTIIADGPLLEHYAARRDLIASSPMFIAVFTPDSPVTIDGQRVVRVWAGHVQDGFAVGKRRAGERFARCGNSGIASLPGEASHVHCCASGSGTLSPNGDLPGLLLAKWLGFNPRVTWVPGPADYQSGAYYRGKKRGG